MAVGSVDDGKSTLLGRLLCDSNGVYKDQLESVQKASARKNGGFDFSLLTDGLKAEREQSITIDVAYRYFSTPRRKFIVADVPGHEQYTRNMATGSSTADAAIVLVDARKGVLEQTLRHIYIAWLFGIRNFAVAVNKMDAVAFDVAVFSRICDHLRRSIACLHGIEAQFFPVSALQGDNVAHRSDRTAWYEGPCLLTFLETVATRRHPKCDDLRFPVQLVIRPNHDYRGYAGQVVSGIVRPGQRVVALPSMHTAVVDHINLYSKTLDQAIPPLCVTLSLATHLDLGRGDMLVSPKRMPSISTKVVANLLWMSSSSLCLNSPYLVKHTTQTVCGSITKVINKLDLKILRGVESDTLHLNDIGRVRLEMYRPIFCDPYTSDPATGSFILIDPADNNTAAAGLIEYCYPKEVTHGCEPPGTSPPIQGPKGLTVWLTGLSGAGKTTISRSVHTELLALGLKTEMLDGDVLRKQLNSDLGFSKHDRDENIRRIGFVAHLLTRNGIVVLVSAISPYRAVRDEIRQLTRSFIEIYVDAPLNVCEHRDPKGLYAKARVGELRDFTGIDAPYEPPPTPEVHCQTDRESIKASVNKVLRAILQFLSS